MGNGNKVEFLVAICALIASAMAVYMAWDQGRVMRAQQHGSVYPVLQVDGFATNNGVRTSIGIRIRNSGVGPALVESVDISIPGQEGQGFGDYAETLPGGYELSWVSITGRALAPGEVVTPVEIIWPVGALPPENMTQITMDAESWQLQICYCSVFDRCWQTLRIGRSRAEAVESCERGETDIFEGLGQRYLLEQSRQTLEDDTGQ